MVDRKLIYWFGAVNIALIAMQSVTLALSVLRLSVSTDGQDAIEAKKNAASPHSKTLSANRLAGASHVARFNRSTSRVRIDIAIRTVYNKSCKEGMEEGAFIDFRTLQKWQHRQLV